MAEKNILFLGSFVQAAEDGTVGGQGFACQSLVSSSLSHSIKWHLIDSTQKTQPPPSLAKRVYYAMQRLFRFSFLLLFKKIDTVLVFTAFSPVSFSEKGMLLLLASLFRKKSVLAIRSEVKTPEQYRRSRWFRKLVLSSCTNIICQTQVNAQALSDFDHKSTAKIIIVPNWIDISPYQEQKLPAIHEATNRERVRFIYLGWLIEYKGVKELIKAAAQVIQNDSNSKNFELHLCGGGPLENELKAEVLNSELSHCVHFHGWIYGKEKIEQLMLSDVLVLPSYTEGMSNAMLEGMSAGLAIIATEVGAAPEVINASNGGQLIQTHDITALANAMRHYIENPAKIFADGVANKQHIASHHQLSVILPKMEAVLGVSEQSCQSRQPDA